MATNIGAIGKDAPEMAIKRNVKMVTPKKQIMNIISISIEIVSLQPKGGVIHEYRRETSKGRASQQIGKVV